MNRYPRVSSEAPMVENTLYPMNRELVQKTQMNQSLHRRPNDIPRVTDEERAYLDSTLSRSYK